MRMRYFPALWTIIFLMGPAQFLFAQCPPDEQLKITSTLYSQENGLLSTILINIAKDSAGYRYFKGVDDNWIRYDGINFSMKEAFNLTSFSEYGYGETDRRFLSQYINNVSSKVEKIPGGNTYRWAIVNDSLLWTNLANNHQRAFHLPAGLTAATTAYYPNGDKCWLSTPTQMFLFDLSSTTFRRIDHILSLTGEPHRIFASTDGTPFLVHETGIEQWDGNAFRSFCTYPALDIGPMNLIMGRYLFVGGADGIFHEIDLENKRLRTIALSQYSNQENVSAFSISTFGNYNDYLLICTANAGLFIYNRCTDKMQHFFYDKRNVKGASVNSGMWLHVDQDNIVWLQTQGGLIKLEIDKQHIRSYVPSEMMVGGVCVACNNVRAIYQLDRNHLLLATLEGVYQFDLVSKKFSLFLNPFSESKEAQSIAASTITDNRKGAIFIGSWNNEGIAMIDGNGKLLAKFLTPGSEPQIAFNNLNTLFYDSKNVLWAGTNKGLIRLPDTDQYLTSNKPGPIKAEDHVLLNDGAKYMINWPVFAITEDANRNIYFGTQGGLYIYNTLTKTIRHYDHDSTDNNSISDSQIRSIYISSAGEVWIGTKNGGLNRFDPSGKFVAYTSDDGLPNNSIYTILEDDNGFLWLGTNRGLCRFRPSDLAVRNYTPRDGIQHFEFNTNAVAVTEDGLFCFGGREGLNLFHPDSMNNTAIPSPVAITKFMIFDKEFPVSEHVIHLPHHQNSFTFDFANLNYYRNNDNQYSYQLEGADKNWIQSGNRTINSYANLQPGTYTFKVRSANYTGAWHPGEASMHLVIHPAWYNTWWFRLALIMGLAGGLYTLYRYRMYQVTKFYTLRNRIASDLHDDIGSTLSSISLSSTIIQQKLNGQHTEVTRLLQQVSKNTDDMMEALSDIVWAIHTRNDRFNNVLNRMRAFAIEVFEPAGIQMHFDISPDLMDIHLNMQQRKNVYLIFKEAINNIVKYAACSQVTINMEKQGTKRWLMEIKDDGKGFEAAFVNSDEMNLSGNGIRNMKKRAEEVNGTLHLFTAPGEGVKVRAIFLI